MNGRELNRRAVENLIKAGAFDSLGYKRKALIQIAGAVLDSIAQSMRDNIDRSAGPLRHERGGPVRRRRRGHTPGVTEY